VSSDKVSDGSVVLSSPLRGFGTPSLRYSLASEITSASLARLVHSSSRRDSIAQWSRVRTVQFAAHNATRLCAARSPTTSCGKLYGSLTSAMADVWSSVTRPRDFGSLCSLTRRTLLSSLLASQVCDRPVERYSSLWGYPPKPLKPKKGHFWRGQTPQKVPKT